MPAPHKNWLIQKQTALGKDTSNPLMADNLPKIVWYSTHHITLMKSWLVQKQTALGKDKSNSLMADNFQILHKLLLFSLTNLCSSLSAVRSSIDKKKVVITEATIRAALHLGDAEGVDFLSTEESFAELARIGYEKPSTKLTFYKAFFSSQWKFLIHTILQSLSAKRTSWNEFSSAMASAVICLSTEPTRWPFNPNNKIYFPALTQKVFTNMRRVGKGFSGVETPLFEGMLVAGVIEKEDDAKEQVQDVAADTAIIEDVVQDQSIPSPTPPTPPPQQSQDLPSTSQALNGCVALTRRVKHLEYDKVAQALEITKLKRRVKKLEKANKVKGRMIDDLDKDDAVDLMDDKGEEKKEEEVKDDQVKGRQAEIYQIDMDHASKIVTAASESVTAATITIAAVEPQVPAATITAALVRVVAASTRRRKGVVIRDPEKESTTIIPLDTKYKDKGKGIMVEEPKPLKKKQQVEMDEEYARKLHEELNKDIDWDVAIDHVKQNANEDPFLQRYQVMKKRPQTESQARRNMIMYLKNVAGFRLDYFKGMSYDDICPIFEAKFNTNIEFLLKIKEQLEEEENIAIQSINETPAQKAAKMRKLNEQVEDLK
nr:hypothetical protein [Tanacetum cinerariifolium]